MKIIKTEEYERAKKEIKEIIKNKKIFIYPTDTVYGIGGLEDKEVLEKIYNIKKRGTEKKASIILGSIEQVIKRAELNEEQIKLFLKYMPGPYTFIVKEKNSEETIGIRIPNYTLLRKVSVELDVGIITTSANISGNKAKYRLEDIEEELKEKVDLIIDGGETYYKKSSTVVDLVNKKILRKGAGEFKEKGFIE